MLLRQRLGAGMPPMGRLGMGRLRSAAAPSYYVDSVNGNDANDGRTQATAFQDPTVVPQAQGLIIGVVAGSTFRKQLTLGYNNMQVVAVGTGAKPLFDCSDQVPSGSWALAGGRLKAYEATVTLAVVGSPWVNAWQDGAFLTRAASAAACESTPGSYFPSGSSGSITLYVHPTDSAHPGDRIAFSARGHGIMAESRSGITVRGIAARRNLHFDGSIWVGNDAIVEDCAADDGSKHNLFVREGSAVRRCTGSGAYYGSSSLIALVAYNDTPTGKNVLLEDCDFSLAAINTLSSAYGCHNSSGGAFGTITARRCKSTNFGTAFNFGNAAAAVIEQPNVPSGAGVIAAQTPIVTLTGGTMSVTTTIAQVLAANVNLTISGATMTTTAGASSVIRSLTQTNANVTLTNNTIPGCGGWMVQMSGSGIVLNATGNSYPANSFGYYDLQTAGYTLTSDYNSFADPNDDVRLVGVTHASVAAYKSATGQDAHST